VREDWKTAKGLVTEAVAKHGGAVRTARRWDERKLAYKIRGRNRATYLLCYVEMPSGGLTAFRREVELSDRILRYLLLRVDAVPAAEHDLSAAEAAEGFVVPAPPPDDLAESEAPEPEEVLEEVLVPAIEDVEDEGAEERPRAKKAEPKASAEVTP
jgi:small subunit ribosomal protein S6